MEAQNNNQNPENDNNNYIYDKETSNPFSNALKNFSALLLKMHLIKPNQTLIGDTETNRKGYQTTSKDVLEATEKKSLKAILRTAFENRQDKRREKINAKTQKNTMLKYTIGGQDKSNEQIQAVTQEFIDPKKEMEARATRRAAEKAQAAQQGQNLINNTVILSQTEGELEETFDTPTSGDISIDTSYTQDTDTKRAETQEVVETPLRTENLTVKSPQPTKIIIPENKKTTKPPTSKNTQEHDEIDI